MNLRLGAAGATQFYHGPPSPGLNSCSGEPAARGLAAGEALFYAPGVSIPVLVNLRLGAPSAYEYKRIRYSMSQFLFW